jgi:hypothetical protein
MAMMCRGQRFTLYTATTSMRVNLFYVPTSPTSGPMGSLFWCEVGRRTQMDDHRLRIDQIRDVYLGKQSPVLISPSANGADPSKCLSLKTDSLTLDLEVSQQLSKSFLTLWGCRIG